MADLKDPPAPDEEVEEEIEEGDEGTPMVRTPTRKRKANQNPRMNPSRTP